MSWNNIKFITFDVIEYQSRCEILELILSRCCHSNKSIFMTRQEMKC